MGRPQKFKGSPQTYCACGEPKGDRKTRCVTCADEAMDANRAPRPARASDRSSTTRAERRSRAHAKARRARAAAQTKEA